MTRSSKVPGLSFFVHGRIFFILLVLVCFVFFRSLTCCAQNSEVTIVVEAENISSERSVKKIKYALPREIDICHVIDSSELELVKDTADGNCYLAGEIEFEPYQTKRFSVSLVDVWKTPISVLEGYLKEAERIRLELEGSPYEDMAEVLFKQIKNQAEAIISGQRPAENIEDHISMARENEKKIAVLWESLERLREIRKGTKKNKSRSMDKEKIEIIMLSLVTFLVVITAVFYFIWIANRKN
jgi:hypothetical protein